MKEIKGFDDIILDNTERKINEIVDAVRELQSVVSQLCAEAIVPGSVITAKEKSYTVAELREKYEAWRRWDYANNERNGPSQGFIDWLNEQ